MWPTHSDVTAYSENPLVASRTEEKLAIDIRRAQRRVLSILNRSVDDEMFADSVPQDIFDAVVLYADYYASIEVGKKSVGIKSESFDDYSYTKDSSTEVAEPDVTSLLVGYVLTGTDVGALSSLSNKVVMRMTAL